MSIYFLGSGHEAKDYPNSGEKTKNPNIYLLRKNNRLSYTVSGPTVLNGFLSERSINLSSKSAISFFKEEILKIRSGEYSSEKNESEEESLYENIEIKIKGHSRGGIIAKIVYESLSKEFTENITFRTPIYLDPYAGPLQRIAKEYREILDNSVIVYTVAEGRFRSPAEAKSAKAVIFTKVAHDRCQFLKPPKEGNDFSSGTCYFRDDFNDEDKELRRFKIDERNCYKQIESFKKIKEATGNVDQMLIENLAEKFSNIKKSRKKYVADPKHMVKIDSKSNAERCLEYLLEDQKIKNKLTIKRVEFLIRRLCFISGPCREAVKEWLNKSKRYPILRIQIEKGKF